MSDFTNNSLLTLWINFFFLLTPFFVFSTFLSVTDGYSSSVKRKLSIKIAIGVAAVCIIMFFGGSYVIKLFGFTVEAFRAGSGVVLLIMAIGLVNSPNNSHKHTYKNEKELLQSAIVPLAVPVTAGPATLGTVILLGLEQASWMQKLLTLLAMVLAAATVGLMLAFSDKILRFLGHSNVAILSKITGLILSALAVQMIVLGVKALWMS